MTSKAATAYILERLGKMLAEDRSAEISASVDLIVKAPKVFVYGVGRSGLVADVMERLGETEATMRGRHAIMV